jgi:flagellar operon protein (TIGR03826 family)
MDVRNCKECKRLFNYIGGPQLCDACKDKLEDKFQEVKEYLWENPKATVAEISEAKEVSTNQLRQWIREERLQLADDSPIAITCENCGKKIITGRYCQECKNKMARGLTEEFGLGKKAPDPEPSKRQDSSNKMRFLQQ